MFKKILKIHTVHGWGHPDNKIAISSSIESGSESSELMCALPQHLLELILDLTLAQEQQKLFICRGE